MELRVVTHQGHPARRPGKIAWLFFARSLRKARLVRLYMVHAALPGTGSSTGPSDGTGLLLGQQSRPCAEPPQIATRIHRDAVASQWDRTRLHMGSRDIGWTGMWCTAILLLMGNFSDKRLCTQCRFIHSGISLERSISRRRWSNQRGDVGAALQADQFGLLQRLSRMLIVWFPAVAIGVCASPGVADTTSRFVVADDEASARGITGYIWTDRGRGVIETWVLGTEFSAIVTSKTEAGGVDMDVCCSGEFLTVRLLEDGVVQVVESGLLAAEVSPDDSGGWSHWGTESFAESRACEALLLCTRDVNLQLLSGLNQIGYWRCVAKVLLCEAYSFACAGSALGSIPACVAACGGPQAMSPACIGCIIAAPGVVAATCVQAWECWQEASAEGCIP